MAAEVRIILHVPGLAGERLGELRRRACASGATEVRAFELRELGRELRDAPGLRLVVMPEGGRIAAAAAVWQVRYFTGMERREASVFVGPDGGLDAATIADALASGATIVAVRGRTLEETALEALAELVAAAS